MQSGEWKVLRECKFVRKPLPYLINSIDTMKIVRHVVLIVEILYFRAIEDTSKVTLILNNSMDRFTCPGLCICMPDKAPDR